MGLPIPVPRLRSRLLTFAAAMLVVVGLCLWSSLFVSDRRSPLAIAVAEEQQRPIEARLTGFEYRERPHVNRSAEDPIDPHKFQVRIKAAELLATAGGSQQPHKLHAMGVAALVIGDFRQAVAKLTAATHGAPSVPRYWNDLAAARYSQGRADNENFQELLGALADADHALRIDAAMTDALFNRALILDAMGLRMHAIAAWKRYSEVDPDSPWSVEARSRLAEIEANSHASERQHALKILETIDPSQDGAVLRDIVNRFPEEARRRGEATFLAAWAESVLAADSDTAQKHLSLVRSIGALLREQRNEPLLAETVATIDACGSSKCRVRIANACRAYDEARRLIGSRRLTEALPIIRSAAAKLHEANVPLALVADYYVVGVLEDSGDVSAAATVNRLQQVVPVRYIALRAQLLWQRGAAYARAGQPLEALDAHLEALKLFDQLGETQNAARMRSDAAAACSLLGREAEAWRLRARVFETLADVGDARAMQNSLTVAARFEATAGRWPTAVSLLKLASDPALLVNQRLHIDALMWRALAVQKLGQLEQARADLREARILTDALPDPMLRAVAADDLSFVEASLLVTTNPRMAAAMLDTYLENSSRRGRTFSHAEAHLERGRSALALNDLQGAEQHFRAALNVDGKRGLSTSDADVFFETADIATRELTALLVRRNRANEAWQTLEATRAVSFGRDASHLDVSTLVRHLAPGAMVLEYVALEDELLIFSIDRSAGLRIHRVSVRRDDLAESVSDLVSAIREGADAEAERIGQTLFARLLAPEEAVDRARCLIIVPDRVIAGTPFAMLRRNDNTDRLLSHAAISMTPSAALAVASASLHDQAPSGATNALLVGDPAFDTSRFPDLPRLPEAAREAREIAGLYQRPLIFVGTEASPSHVVSAMPQSAIVHLGAHAVVNERDPMRSMFLFAPADGSSGALYSRDIARMNLNGTRVVVLAGCRTADTAAAPSNVGSLALAFLHAGAPAVIGALWPLDDLSAARFSRRLHNNLSRGINPADASREAQLELMRDSSLRVWAGYVTIIL